MKKPDIEKETQFVELFAVTGNATESARKSGYEKNPSQMGYFLKTKLRKEIEEHRANHLFDLSGGAIVKLQELMKSESDSVSLNACKLILDLGGYSAEQTINLRTSRSQDEIDKLTDEEMQDRIVDLIDLMPEFKEKLFKLKLN